MDTKDDIVVEGDLESGVIKIPISFKETWKRKKVEGKTKVKDDDFALHSDFHLVYIA